MTSENIWLSYISTISSRKWITEHSYPPKCPVLTYLKIQCIFPNGALLNKAFRHLDDPDKLDTKKIVCIIQQGGCLFSYLDRRYYIMLFDHNKHENPFISAAVSAPGSAAACSFLAPCAAWSPKSKGKLLEGISCHEMMMMWMDGWCHVKSSRCQ